MRPSPTKMEDDIFSGSVSFTNTDECIQHYSICNMLLPYCLGTSNVANIQMLDSVRSASNTDWTTPPPPRTLFKRVKIITLVII